MEASVTWKGRMSFSGTAGTGFTLPMGAEPAVGGDNDGFRPMELFLVGLAGCTGMDVISILAKMKQDVKKFDIKINADRGDSHPRIFTHITIEYIFEGENLDRKSVERAVELSATRYCPGQAMLSKSVSIDSKITIR